jgi:hypothetical protein
MFKRRKTFFYYLPPWKPVYIICGFTTYILWEAKSKPPNYFITVDIDLGGEVNGGQPEECMGGPSGPA